MTAAELLAAAPIEFTPTEHFWSESMRSQYCTGLKYTIKPGLDKLAGEVEKWLADGKVVLIDPSAPKGAEARIFGAGMVA